MSTPRDEAIRIAKLKLPIKYEATRANEPAISGDTAQV
jgi:ribosomal protein L16/L10AE